MSPVHNEATHTTLSSDRGLPEVEREMRNYDTRTILFQLSIRCITGTADGEVS